MHNPKLENAAYEYLNNIPGEHRFTRAQVIRHLVGFYENYTYQLAQEKRCQEAQGKRNEKKNN